MDLRIPNRANIKDKLRRYCSKLLHFVLSYGCSEDGGQPDNGGVVGVVTSEEAAYDVESDRNPYQIPPPPVYTYSYPEEPGYASSASQGQNNHSQWTQI
jgi:hypothetical protein